MADTNPTPAVVEDSEALSPHQQAMLKAGEKLIVESIQTGREFCKALVGVAFSAVPIYVGLVGLVIPKDTAPAKTIGLVWVVPVVIFLVAASVAVFGYLPERRLVSIDLPEELKNMVSGSIARRYWSSVAAFALLVVGVGVSVGVISGVGG